MLLCCFFHLLMCANYFSSFRKLSLQIPNSVIWWWLHHPVVVLFSSRDREVGKTRKKDGWS